MELVRFPSRGGFSVRSILTFALTVLITAFLWATLSSAPSHAQSSNNGATWDGASLRYEGNQYIASGEVKENDGSGLPVGSKIYTYAEQGQTTGSASAMQKAHIIYFTPGTDPPSATSAGYVKLDFNSTTKKFSNPTDKKTISVSESESSDTASSCTIPGIGWMVCPVMSFLSSGMDVIFSLIADFMKVQPLQTGNVQGSLYSAWNIMRSIGNIAFIIAFIIIIYSQLTSVQVNNYGIKRLLPRLIIAAVAVNMSYIICAIAVDASNILGYALQDVFIGLKDQILSTGGTDNTAEIFNWQSITGFVLSGGTAALAAGIGIGTTIVATGGTATAAVFILLPALVGLLLAILVVLLILAARQALIVILVVISPLALVAYLLPNTEKWFTKWRELLMVMLIFFPAFSVVFGGSQLAGAIIIKNATSINMIILGMIVQVAPLVITPLLLKFSGSLLGNLARLVNNPNKGLIDRTRNWAKGHADMHRQRGISGMRFNGDPGQLRKRNFVRQTARHLDQRKRRREDLTKNATTATEAAYLNSRSYNNGRAGNRGRDLAQQTAAFEADKELAQNRNTARVDRLKSTRPAPGGSKNLVYGRALDVQASKENVESAQNNLNAHFNRQRTLAGTALNATSNYLEYSKMTLETSEGQKTIYQTSEKLTTGTLLNQGVAGLETSKMRVEQSQSQYTTMVDGMKIKPGSALHNATLGAQSAKELQEAAQNKLQAFFDQQRRTAGASLNLSTLELEQSKLTVDASKSLTAAYVNAEKLAVGSDLHLEVVRAEQAKLAGQVAETRVSKMVEEYKSGKIVRTGELNTLMTTMVDDVEHLAAETQGSSAAQNIQKKNIAEAFTAGTPRATDLLRTAQSVDQYGDVRAEASALATLDEITNKARSANEALIEERAVAHNMTPKNYAMNLLSDRLDGNMDESEDLIRAAMEIAGKEAQIPIIRKMRMSNYFNQDHLTAMLLRNSGTMKAKGGFDLQNDTGLVHASQEAMNASIAGTLGSVAAEQFKDLKNGAFIEYASDMEDIIANTQAMQASQAADPEVRKAERKAGENGMVGLQKAYFNLTLALNDPQMVRALGDNLLPAIDMHKTLHARFNNPGMSVDYHKIDPRDIASNLRPEDLGEGLGS